MRVAPASSEFSSSSLATEAGRSTTSPAAILLATFSERTWILPIRLGDPSLRSGFRLRAPASLAPAKRLTFAGGDLVGDVFGKDVNSAHVVRISLAPLGISAACSRFAHARKAPQLRPRRPCWRRFRKGRGFFPF